MSNKGIVCLGMSSSLGYPSRKPLIIDTYIIGNKDPSLSAEGGWSGSDREIAGWGDAAIMIHLEFFTHVTTTANLMGKHLTQRFPNIKSIKTIQRKREGRTLL